MDEETVTTGDDFDYPPDDSDETWHLEDDHWGWGILCDKCDKKPKIRNEAPHFNIHHLKVQNEVGMTVNEWRKDIFADRDPEEIQRAR